MNEQTPGDKVVRYLLAAKSKLNALFAPAGYGKTKRAKALGSHFASHIYVSAEAGDTALALLQRIADALAALPAGTKYLLTVDDAHCIDDASLRAIISEFFATMPANGRLLICSEREPAFTLTEFGEAADVSVFRRAQLALSFAQRSELVGSAASLPPGRFAQILSLSNGWPAVTHYLARAAGEGRFETMMRSLNRPEWRDLFDWIEARVVGKVPSPVFQALVYAAACTDAQQDDFAIDGNGRREDVPLFRDYQLADIGVTGEIRVLPVLRHFLYATRAADLRSAAEAQYRKLSADDPVRAARAMIDVGALREAEQLLAPLPIDAKRTVSDYAYPGTSLEMVSTAPPYSLFPNVWYSLLAARRAVVPAAELAVEAEEILDGALLSEREGQRFVGIAAVLRLEAGDEARSTAHVERLKETLQADDPILDIVLLTQDHRAGRYRSALERWRRTAPALLGAPAWYGWLAFYALRSHVCLGEYERGQRMVNLLLSLSTSGAGPNLASAIAIEAALFAWLMGDDQSYGEYRSEASQIARYYDTPLRWNTIAALYGIPPDEADDAPCSVTGLYGVMLARSLPTGLAVRLLKRTMRDADDGGNMAVRVLSRVQLAQFDASGAAHLLEEAMQLALQTDSRFIQASVEAAMRGSLEGLCRTLRRPETETPHAPAAPAAPAPAPPPPEAPVFIDVADQRITKNGEAIRVSERVRQLLICLATSRSPLRREVIVDRIWPELEGDAAAAALKMCVHRARQQLAEHAAIDVVGGMYSLGAGARSDYFAMLKRATASHKMPLPADVRADHEVLFERLCRGLGTHPQSWPWLAPVATALTDAAMHLGEQLYRDARARGDLQRAQLVARQLIQVRPEAEMPRVLIIELHGAMGNELFARREYDEYARMIREHGGGVPSERLRRLVPGA